MWSFGGLVAGLAGVLLALLLRPAAPLLLRLDGSDYLIRTDSEGAFRASIAAAVTRAAARLETDPIYLRAQEEHFALKAADLGVQVPIRGEIERARVGLTDVHVRVDENWQLALYRRLIQLPEIYTMQLQRDLERARTRSLLEQLAQQIVREPVDAALRIDAHDVVRSRPGRALSLEGSLLEIEAALARDGILLVDLEVEAVPPRVTDEQLLPVDVTQVLSTYETSFRGKAGARAVNIRRAASYLDGALLLPGEVLSFNEIVGRRVHGRGFVDAPVIINDEMEKDVGGGVCQVATTLHAAAVFGNLEVVQRRSHSRPSGYAPLGLDATVIDGKVDLRLRNPYDEPLLVHVSFPGPYKVRVELLGRSPEVQVEHAFAVTAQEPFSRRVWRREKAGMGAYEQRQKGSPGMDGVSVLRISHSDGRVERRQYRSKYYPVPEVFWVSPRGDTSALPALPEGVQSLVIDGELVQSSPSSTQADPEIPQTEVPSYHDADGSSYTGG